MSLTKPSLMSVVKKQFAYKLMAYTPVFTTLIFIQLLAILFSFGGTGGGGSSSNNLEINIHYYSADIIVIFTMLWGLITAILITTKAYRNDDFAFVTNRLSSNLSNFLFLLMASILGGITAMLSTSLLKVIMYYFVGWKSHDFHHLMGASDHLMLGLGVSVFYVLLFSALGYFIGTLIQINKAFTFLLPAAVIGMLILEVVKVGPSIWKIVYDFIFDESSLTLFVFKILVTVGILFSSAFVLSNRMEVRQPQ